MFKYPLNVTIDTNVFDSCKYDFSDTGTLNHLVSYVEKKKIKVFLSNVVIQEMDRHIQSEMKSAISSLNNAKKELSKKYSNSLLNAVGIDTNKQNKNEIGQLAHEELENYLNKLQVEILDNKSVDLDQILDAYFNYKLPFENNDKKRKEFPDAIIIEQIKCRFESGENIIIVSNDNGFKGAFGNQKNFSFYKSLGELFDQISREENDYKRALELFEIKKGIIFEQIEYLIHNKDCIDVYGLSYDKDGIECGHDYSETELEKFSDITAHIHVVDEIRDEIAYLTLISRGTFIVNCYYEDYENAIWDSETKSYLYLNTCGIQEKHEAVFPIRMELNLKTEELNLHDFRIRLGGDSRKECISLDEEEDYDYYTEIEDMDRESVGFRGLGQYENWLEEDLQECEMQETIVDKMEELNKIYNEFQEIYGSIDEILDQLRENEKQTIDILEKHERELNEADNTYPLNKNIEEINLWLEKMFSIFDKFASINELPDYFEYGDTLHIIDANGKTYELSLDAINIHPSAGDEEIISIKLSNDDEVVGGYVKLTVGYLDFDDNNNALDGIEDDIEYFYDEISEKLESIIKELQNILTKYVPVKKVIDQIIDELF